MNQIPVYLEEGQKKTFACAPDWPGWCRSAKDQPGALQSLLEYAPRYARAMAGLGIEFRQPENITEFKVADRQPGSATTDFGAPDGIFASDQTTVDGSEFLFFQAVLRGGWQEFDRIVQAARGKELRKGPRGGGRDQAKILRHVLDGDQAYLRRLAFKFRGEPQAPLEAEIVRLRQAILQALQAAQQGALPAQGPRGGTLWPVRFFVRRLAWHTLDHAWEIEDRLER